MTTAKTKAQAKKQMAAKDTKEVEKRLRKRGIDVPTNFSEMVEERENCGSIYVSDVDEVIKLASFWKPCIEEEYYNEFVLELVFSLYRIHTIVVNSNPNSGFFIGKKARLKENQPPLLNDKDITTIMSCGGHASFKSTSSRYKFD